MRRIVLCLSLLLLSLSCICFAKEPDFMSLVALSPGITTREQVTELFGKPERVEDSKKTVSWYYNNAGHSVILSWNKKSDEFVKCSFVSKPCEKTAFDPRLSRKLRSGTTDLAQTLSLLGTPKDMTIKESKQEVHYTYQNNVLRLFFRDRILVDYTLLGQGGNGY